MKKIFILFAALVFTATMMASCEPINGGVTPEEPKDTIPVKLDPLKQSVPVTDNWVFDTKPAITIHIENPNAVAVEAKVIAKITTDLKKAVTSIEKVVEVPANGTLDVPVTTPEDLAPGFYRAHCIVNNKGARTFNFGISPEKIVSAPDKQPDFDEYWAAAKEQLDSIDMNAQLTLLEKKSTDKRKIYLVELQSVPDSPDGDPVIVRGYYAEPQDGQKHPVIMHFYGYDSQNATSWPPCPGGNDSEYAEFFFSIRGQMLNNRGATHRYPDGKEEDFVNIYGDWFAYNFGVKDGYYYRGAFMDCVQAVRFMATRESSDMTQLFAEGSSQGGALSYAVAALSDYPFTAIAPCVAFLGDFPDYFNIVSWPAETAKANKGSMTDEEMYAFLSYFDTKNLATRISAAVIACSGLQDGTCPPHTNLAPFNNLLTEDKVIYYYPEMGHEIPSDWNKKIMTFFKERMK
ncbi:MAG: acetylxylan esterase [Paludibacteraceae bacterium]|nr:acetylxylan esterase [Paludibacteraceae bacterium]